jgi:phospholipase C
MAFRIWSARRWAPNPDAGEEHPHTNTQLFGTVAPEDNRFVSYEQMKPPFKAPDDRRVRRHGSTVTQGGIRDLGSLKAVTPPPRKRSHHDNLL